MSRNAIRLGEAGQSQEEKLSENPSKFQKQRRSPDRMDRIKTSLSAPARSASTSLEVSSEGVMGGAAGNLPVAYHGISWNGFEASSQGVILTPQAGARLKGIRKGDVLAAVIEDEIEVWPGASSPVRAFVSKGEYRGAVVSGSATMDPARKKIMIVFDRLKMPGGSDTTYSLKAEVRDATGRYGLSGNYHSESGLFLLGETLAATAAGLTDATIQRTQNQQGNYVQEPSLLNAAKTGAATALARRADRFAQSEGKAPEWTELGGYHEVQIFIQIEPTEDSG
jgi:hypothetical protein